MEETMKTKLRKSILALTLLLLGISLFPLTSTQTTAPEEIYARLNTSKGVILLSLEFEKAPLTTANFVGLAEGTIENGVFPLGRPFFNGSRFHRVVPGHVIQAGAPDREGAEETDYTFPNEIIPGLSHDQEGILGMANSGPHTNSSQFYITLADRSYLDGDYTVFGRVVEGMEVVKSIVQGDVIWTVEIERLGPLANAFRPDTASFRRQVQTAKEHQARADALRQKEEDLIIRTNWPKAVATPSGLKYIVRQEGRGVPPEKDVWLKVLYSGMTLDGKQFYSGAEAGRPRPDPPAQDFLYMPGRTDLTPALESALSGMKTGEKRTVIAPAAMAYGRSGFYAKQRPGEKRFVISPGSTLIYDLELLDTVKPDYGLRPVPFSDVQFTDRFWAPRLETNRRVTIPAALQKCLETGRIRNFENAAAILAGTAGERKFASRYPFDDSDVYKIIEGASLALRSHPDPALDGILDSLIAKIVAAQEPDGYLYTARTIFQENPFLPWVDSRKRWSNLRFGHELYNAGHLYEAAAAHFQATGKRSLLEAALKNADLVAGVFGPGLRHGLPGHEEIEIGLVKLYSLTGQRKYLDLAKFFIEERGRPVDRESFGEYAQDHKPLLEQTEPVGHAVRAAYLYSAAADVSALTANKAYRQALEKIWLNTVSRKMYLTGGMGALGGIEGFGPDYDLPNATAYCETCASIASALWNHRMFLLSGDGKYLDVLERLLYNGILSGIGLSGDLFFYANPLASSGEHKRSPWFSCACCPSNLSRFIPSLPGYVYAWADNILYVNLFVDSSASLKLNEGQEIQVRQSTNYPWEGAVQIFVDPQTSQTMTLAVRIPGWARSEPVPSDLYRFEDGLQPTASLKLNGQSIPLELDKGFVKITRRWARGDMVDVDLPMPVRRVKANMLVRDDLDRVAFERGPIVYCLEAVDNLGRVSNLVLPAGAALEFQKRDDLVGGIVVLKGRATASHLSKDGKKILRSAQELTAIPYYAWAHRGQGEMVIWLPVEETASQKK
jgi:DUF1680 family protein/cyclophilin family peptidyl-prolyl cis-trans isomerase